MTIATSFELTCAREMPFKKEVLSFIGSNFRSRLKFSLVNRLISKNQSEILDAVKGKPLFMRILSSESIKVSPPLFIKTMKAFFKKDVVTEMHTAEGDLTLIFF